MTAAAIVTFRSRESSLVLDGRPARRAQSRAVTCKDAGQRPIRTGRADLTRRAKRRSRTYRTSVADGRPSSAGSQAVP